jgi:PhnB protein
MPRLNPYVRFDGNAREAFEFYQSCLGGELSLQTVADSSMAAYMPDKQSAIFHAELKNNEIILLGSDMVSEKGLIKGNTMVLTLECETKAQAEEFFTKLSAGGTVGHALAEEPWGTIGDLADKFGVDWFLVVMNNAS